MSLCEEPPIKTTVPVESPNPVPIEKSNLSNKAANGFQMLPVSSENLRPSRTENSSPNSSIKSPSGKPVLSRLHLIKQAGAKMAESGQTTRISAAVKVKK